MKRMMTKITAIYFHAKHIIDILAMKEKDDDKRRTYIKRFIKAADIYIYLFLLSAVLYRIDAFEANTFVYIVFWLLSLVLMCISYKENLRYKFYDKYVPIMLAGFLALALLEILLD